MALTSEDRRRLQDLCDQDIRYLLMNKQEVLEIDDDTFQALRKRLVKAATDLLKYLDTDGGL